MSRVIIRNGVFGELPALLGAPRAAAVITDSVVGPLYAEDLCKRLEQAGFRIQMLALPAGEQSKNLETYGRILQFLAGMQLSRSDLVIALGGGVVGDAAGFAAATYLRGLPLVQVPTTLLAQVDSAIGGKTGIDLPQGKNLAGAFHPARMVAVDPQLLKSLPYARYREGLAEVVKYGAIRDAELFHALPYEESEQEDIIRRCVNIKLDIVSRDERDRGERQLLNFGHTVAHALEKLSGYQLSHGGAVAIGMAVTAKACQARGICGSQAAGRLCNMLHLLGLPTETAYGAEQVLDAIISDKKRQGGSITLALLHDIGDCRLHTMPLHEAQVMLKEGFA